MVAARNRCVRQSGIYRAATAGSDRLLSLVACSQVLRSRRTPRSSRQGFRWEDFQISDNGSPQKILYFPTEETPLDLILLFDIRGSMQPKLEKLATSAHAALAQLRKGDRVAVMVFTTKSRIVGPFTDDMRAVEQTIHEKVLGKA